MDKITKSGRQKSTESAARGSAEDTGSVTLTPPPSADQSRSVEQDRPRAASLQQKRGNRANPVDYQRGSALFFVPVVAKDSKVLMPTTLPRAMRWVGSGKATPFWNHGVFCVRLNVEPSGRKLQPVAIGIDPGSKREAFTVKSESHTYLNVLTEAVAWIKKAVEQRRNARRGRRFRKTPCRQNRMNRSRGGLPPSTKARWQWKLRLARWLARMFPIEVFVVEDIKAKTKGKRKWDSSFSPLEVGKAWFYAELRKIAEVKTKAGFETKQLRDALGLKKSHSKLADTFECHNVDSWVLANSWVDGHAVPDNKVLIKLVPLRLHRRHLHLFQPTVGGLRRSDGGTRSLGFTRGGLVRHPKFGICFVGGTMNGKLSLHDCSTGSRLTQNAKVSDIDFLCYNSWNREAVIHPHE